jgi:hypothetical protein
MMVETMGLCDTPKENIENMLRMKQLHFPEQPLDWVYLLDLFAEPSNRNFHGAPFQEHMRFLFIWGMLSRVEALAFKLWRDYITNMIHTVYFQYNRDNLDILREIQAKIDHFEDERFKLKEVTTILELALWKSSMNEKSYQDMAIHSQRKIKTEGSSFRKQCHITCGAVVVISHVLPYLINVADEDSASYAESDSYASSHDESGDST